MHLLTLGIVERATAALQDLSCQTVILLVASEAREGGTLATARWKDSAFVLHALHEPCMSVHVGLGLVHNRAQTGSCHKLMPVLIWA